ncbi:MAG: type II toxin-antitoxin system RelB/DinJ family antitoxin [Bacteroidales bacterium]|nr:type II toxin-antitoxin system RelB/DinJ family antitoxin [Bacteroidales bacterium]
MSQVSMTVRMDSGLKSSFDALCSQFGMSANTAMNIFAKAVVQRGKIPFEIRGDKPVAAEESEGLKAFRAIRAMAEAGAFPDLTLDEINEEIREARRTR